mgnify:CR=1 FL=1
MSNFIKITVDTTGSNKINTNTMVNPKIRTIKIDLSEFYKEKNKKGISLRYCPSEYHSKLPFII